MGILAALQGLKNYWQYLLMCVLLIIIVVIQTQKNYWRVEALKNQAIITQYQAESEAQQMQYDAAEKEIKILKKQQDEELNSLQAEIIKIDNNTPCEKAIESGVKAARSLK